MPFDKLKNFIAKQKIKSQHKKADKMGFASVGEMMLEKRKARAEARQIKKKASIQKIKKQAKDQIIGDPRKSKRNKALAVAQTILAPPPSKPRSKSQGAGGSNSLSSIMGDSGPSRKRKPRKQKQKQPKKKKKKSKPRNDFDSGLKGRFF